MSPGTIGTWVLIVLVLLGAVPLLVAVYQYLLIGLHRFRAHDGGVAEHLPRTVVLIPAWNEAAVLDASIDQLMALDYPRDRLRVYVVDDASTDATPDVLARKAEQYPGAVHHLRREQGGQGKAHTLNHGLAVVLGEPWMEALLIMDADVVYEPASLRRMTRHLADPEVGAVTAYIKEGSRPGTAVTRFVAYEYVTAQAAGRRAQNVIGALACLAGGAQLHSRANLEALGGRIDTTTLAEDTITTFETQLAGRRAVFEPNAVAWAEEPGDLTGLWKQRLRWGRGNVQVTRRYRHLWFRPSAGGRLGSVTFALIWFSIAALPVFMVVSSAALVALWFLDDARAYEAFRWLWITSALSYLFITAFSLLIDPATARRSWRQAIAFPGLVSLAFIFYACFPAPTAWLVARVEELVGVELTAGQVRGFLLFAYLWVALCMVPAYLGKCLDRAGLHRTSRALLYVVGYGPFLCAITFAAYVLEARGAAQVWDKTEKTGKVAIR